MDLAIKSSTAVVIIIIIHCPSSQHPNDRRLQEELDKCLRTIDALNMKNAVSIHACTCT